jgi:hypothetical protein
MQKVKNIPGFVSIVAIGLGTLDLIRGFMHTIRLEHAAANLAGLDLSSTVAVDLLRLMGAFGISNYITGLMLILLGWKARSLALAMLAAIPIAYFVGAVGIRFNTAAYPASQADWKGESMMAVYLVVCIVTFLAGLIMAKRKKHR